MPVTARQRFPRQHGEIIVLNGRAAALVEVMDFPSGVF
jgi:hypothetical protein